MQLKFVSIPVQIYYFMLNKIKIEYIRRLLVFIKMESTAVYVSVSMLFNTRNLKKAIS